MNEALRDAWLAEMWRPVREVPREERAAERERAEVAQECARRVDKPGDKAAS